MLMAVGVGVAKAAWLREAPITWDLGQLMDYRSGVRWNSKYY